MRAALIVLWLFVGTGGLIYHLGPGEQLQTLDRVSNLLDRAHTSAADGNWHDAVELYDQALGLLPPERLLEQREVRLEKHKAQMLARQLPDARLGLEVLLDELLDDASSPHTLVAETRSALASAQYYNTWLMRLEGLPRDEWEAEIEAARQHYRLLSESAEAGGDDTAARQHKEDLEAAIRLARLDLAELQALPLPSQCQGCSSCKGQGRKRGPPRDDSGGGAGFTNPGEGSGS